MKNLIFILLLAIAAMPARADLLMSKTIRDTYATIQSKDLTNEEKIARLREILKAEQPSALISFIAQVDLSAARSEAMALFRNPETPRQERLRLGKQLLQHLEQPNFIDEYAPFLLALIADGGEAEFMAVKAEGESTAIGELSFMSNGFEGFKAIDFDHFKDSKLAPLLTGCLAAPDRVYGEQSGCIVLGKPGESSGRNTERQHLPIALARLGATEAVPKLAEVVRTHHDIYLRSNAAYAVAFLGNPAERKSIEVFLRNGVKGNYNHWVLYAFGKGLIERGDAAGVEFMSPRYWAGNRDLSETLYYSEEPLKLLATARSADAESVLMEITRLTSLRAGFKISDKGAEPNRARLIARFRQLVEAAEFQQSVRVVRDIASIAADSAEPQIKSVGADAALRLAPAK